jgi:hypothetical protein
MLEEDVTQLLLHDPLTGWFGLRKASTTEDSSWRDVLTAAGPAFSHEMLVKDLRERARRGGVWGVRTATATVDAAAPMGVDRRSAMHSNCRAWKVQAHTEKGQERRERECECDAETMQATTGVLPDLCKVLRAFGIVCLDWPEATTNLPRAKQMVTWPLLTCQQGFAVKFTPERVPLEDLANDGVWHPLRCVPEAGRGRWTDSVPDHWKVAFDHDMLTLNSMKFKADKTRRARLPAFLKGLYAKTDRAEVTADTWYTFSELRWDYIHGELQAAGYYVTRWPLAYLADSWAPEETECIELRPDGSHRKTFAAQYQQGAGGGCGSAIEAVAVFSLSRAGFLYAARANVACPVSARAPAGGATPPPRVKPKNDLSTEGPLLIGARINPNPEAPGPAGAAAAIQGAEDEADGAIAAAEAADAGAYRFDVDVVRATARTRAAATVGRAGVAAAATAVSMTKEEFTAALASEEDRKSHLRFVTDVLEKAIQRSADLKYRFMQLVAGFAGKNISDVAYLRGDAGEKVSKARKDFLKLKTSIRSYANAEKLERAERLAAQAPAVVVQNVARIRDLVDRAEPPVNGEVVRELALLLEAERDKEFTVQYDATLDNMDWTAPFAAAVEMAMAKVRGRVDEKVTFDDLTECSQGQTTRHLEQIKQVWDKAVDAFTNDQAQLGDLYDAGRDLTDSVNLSDDKPRYEKKLCNKSLTTLFAYLISRQYILGLNLNARDYRKLIDYRRVIAQENAVVAQIRRLWCRGGKRGNKRCKREGRSVMDAYFLNK